MIDLDQLQLFGGKITVKPSDNIFYELGNNTYDFKDLLSELIDNSIAARRLDVRLKISIEFWVDNKNNCGMISIKDNALGIPQDKLGLSLSPAALQSKNSLNEHGLGMKQAISALGTLKYLATKTPTVSQAIVVRELKYGELDCYSCDYPDISGTEICIEHIKPIVNVNPQSVTMTLVPYLGARYRRFLRPENRLAEISILSRNLKTGGVLYSWDVTEVKPYYFHPSNRMNKPVIENRKISGPGWKAELTFGYAPTEYELKELGIDPLPHYHPYTVSLSKQGLDIILYDRVVLFHQLSELGIVNVRHSDYNLARGEINLLEGFITAITKNSIIIDDHFMDCIAKVKDILEGSDDEKGYLKVKRYPAEIPERLLRDRLKNWLENNPVNKKNNVKTEYTIEGLAGSIDILADGEAWEIKRDQADGLDVYQLFAYMDMGNIDKGFLLATSHTTGAAAACDFIKEKHKKEIILAERKDFPINHTPYEDERKEYY
ncbi:MAG TPA: ATP-binding protein [Dehalococcoidia bacterium]|nr:ATP-binding protein [Dehalococcoidia bacterium]